MGKLPKMMHAGHVITLWQNAYLDGACIAMHDGKTPILTTRDEATRVGLRVVLDADEITKAFKKPPTIEEADAWLVSRSTQ